DRPAVDGEVPVAHQLPRLGARGAEAEAVDDVVQPALEVLEEHRAGDPLAGLGPLEVVPELGLEHPVEAPGALLGAQLDAVVAHLAAAGHAVLAGRQLLPPLQGALGDALLALEEELDALAAAE